MSGSVVLFTRDLRVHDQPALAEAAASGEPVAPLFVLDDALLRRSRTRRRWALLLESLDDLRASLRALGADLVVRRGDPVAETVGLLRETGARRVLLGADVSPYAAERERRLARACEAERRELRVVETITVVGAGALTPAGGDHYRVFSPYWRRWRSLPKRAPLPAPDRLALPAGLTAGELPRPARAGGVPPAGGEAAGRRRLEDFLRDGLAAYDARRDDLGADATSRLSPYLHFGCVSAAELAARASAAEGFLRQVCWRDFFAQLLAANHRLLQEDLHPPRAPWREDAEAFARWREGATGEPLVDAAMQQLAHEGWLPNRARLVVGSYLTKTLRLDWRLGARVFAELLVDADVANNIGNWQWVAGTGADPRPYRRLNPALQARRHDPDGAYVRRQFTRNQATFAV